MPHKSIELLEYILILMPYDYTTTSEELTRYLKKYAKLWAIQLSNTTKKKTKKLKTHEIQLKAMV